jgi:hypothetical protein
MEIAIIALSVVSPLLIVPGVVLFCWGAIWGAVRENGLRSHGNNGRTPGRALLVVLSEAVPIAFTGAHEPSRRLTAQGAVLIVLGLIAGITAIPLAATQ